MKCALVFYLKGGLKPFADFYFRSTETCKIGIWLVFESCFNTESDVWPRQKHTWDYHTINVQRLVLLRSRFSSVLNNSLLRLSFIFICVEYHVNWTLKVLNNFLNINSNSIQKVPIRGPWTNNPTSWTWEPYKNETPRVSIVEAWPYPTTWKGPPSKWYLAYDDPKPKGLPLKLAELHLLLITLL